MKKKGDNASEPGHKLLRDGILGMRRKSGIIHLAYPGMSFEELCDRLTVGVVLRDAYRQGLQSALEQECRCGIADASEGHEQVRNRLDKASAACQNACDKVVVSTKVLGGGMHNQIYGTVQWPEVDGCGKRAIHYGQEAPSMPQLRKPLDVYHIEVGVGGHLCEDQPGRWPNYLFNCLKRWRHHAGGYPKLLEEHGAKIPCAFVAVASDDHVVAALEACKEQCSDGGHTACKKLRLLSSLQGSQPPFDRGHCGIAHATIFWLLAFRMAFNQVNQILG